MGWEGLAFADVGNELMAWLLEILDFHLEYENGSVVNAPRTGFKNS